MASLLTDAEKTAINSALSDVHDTFARTIYVYVEEASTMPSELNFNPLYGRNKNVSKISSEETLTKHSLSGCGPGALPPDVTNLAPLGLMSE